MKQKRLTPEESLKKIKDEESSQKKGKLKIYLGASPGVGKTYAMLQGAIVQKQQGRDIVIGVVESHGRKEIEGFIEKLEVLPRQKIEYRGLMLEEFDLDAALKRQPDLLLMDELAHTNAPGLRHQKRWQDIEELLENGINVHTTLNIQHVESQSDIISQIIHSPIRETVPDSLLKLANTIEVVDIPDDELLKRLEEGKIYFPERIEVAKTHFFQKGNLIALRELTLRLAASLVETQVMLYRHGHGIKMVWPTTQKILVCIGPKFEDIKLVRTASRIANNLRAEWIALYVESAKSTPSQEQHNMAMQHLHTAEQLGADTRLLSGFNRVETIMSFAREQNITQIVVGKKVRSWFKSLFFRDLADEIVQESGEIDVYVVTGPFNDKPLPSATMTQASPSWKAYLTAINIIIFITIINFSLFGYLYSYNLMMLYIIGVTATSLLGQIGPSIFSSFASVLAYYYFFDKPYFSFRLPEVQSIITLLVMLLVSLVISNLAYLTRRQAEIARYAEKRTAALYKLSTLLARVRGVNKILDVAVQYIGEIFNSHVLALYAENGRLAVKGKFGSNSPLKDKDQSIAEWVYKSGKMAGLGTDTLAETEALYIPLLVNQKSIGVLRLRPDQSKRLFTPEELYLLESCLHGVGLALEIERSAEGSASKLP